MKAYYTHPESDCAFVAEAGLEGDGCLMEIGEVGPNGPSQAEFEQILISMGASPPFYQLKDEDDWA